MAEIPELNSSTLKRILIVDDEPYNLLGLKVIIEVAVSDINIMSLIDQASNGLDALKKVQAADE